MNRAMIREHPFRPTSFLVLPQIGLGLSSGFLDGPSMVVLMTGQCRAAGESLLAIGVRAFVGSLPRMDPTMPGK